MKLNLNVNMTDLEGQEVIVQDHQGKPTGERVNLGKLLGNVLASDSEHADPVKLVCWALDLAKGKEIDLDKSDQKTLRDYVEKSKRFTALQKYQIIELIDNPKPA